MKLILAHSVSVFVAALMFAPFPVFAGQADLATDDARVDSVMSTYTSIAWRDTLNLSYANLGNDQFLLDTQQGLLLWDEPTNSFSPPKFAPEIGEIKLEKMNDRFETIAWARLGSHPADTLVRVTTGMTTNQLAQVVYGLANKAGISSTGRMANTLLWWDGKNRRFAAALSVGSTFAPRLLSLGPHHALVCISYSGGRVLRLQQAGDKTSLMWEESDNPEARAALRSTGVVGAHGYEDITEADIERPVFYDASFCGWEIKNPPQNSIRQFLDKRTRKYEPDIKPYFLADGRTLLSEVDYFDGQNRRRMNPPLLWQPTTHSWVTIERTSGEGGETHREGQEEPVMSHAFGSSIVEFLDTKTMHWVPSRQRLSDRAEKIEPLSNGQAVVFLSDGRDQVKVPVGLIAPVQESQPQLMQESQPLPVRESEPLPVRESEPLAVQESPPPMKQSSSSKQTKLKTRRSKSLDLRHCLELETNAAIAKCAGE